MVYILFQVGLLAGFLAFRQFDELRYRIWSASRKVPFGPAVATPIAVVGPGVSHLLMGRILSGICVLGALITVLGGIPVPWQISSISAGLSLVPLWLLNVVDAWLLSRRLTSVR